ncbi:MAG: uroporphyrinogen decarboxylase family protein [Promethearchaeota archaeon]
MNVRERILTALELGQPDRVPSFFEGMMEIFKSNFFQKYEDEIEDEDVLIGSFGDLTPYKYLKVDSVWLHSFPIKMAKLNIDFDKIDLSKYGKGVASLNRWGMVSKLTKVMGRPHSYYYTGYLDTEEKWREWIDAGYFDYEIDNDWINRWKKAYKEALDGGVMLIPVDTTWEKIREGMGMAKWAYFMRKKPDFIKLLLDKLYQIYKEAAKALVDTGFDVVTWADDAAYKERTMINPKKWETLIVPYYTKLNKICHKGGILTFYHSDGYTEPFFNGLIKSGFNGVQSLEPAAGMNLKTLKEEYGNKICLIGNIDVSRLLPFGSKQEIINEVKKEIFYGGKNGGYIFSPCTDIIDSIPPESIKIMMDAVIKYGKYPLNFSIE